MTSFRRCCLVLASLAYVLVEAPARAQDATSAESLDAPSAAQPTFWQGGGVKLSEAMFFHPHFDLQTGYQTNVFYQADSDGGGLVGSPLMRIGVGGLVQSESNRGEAVAAEGSATAGAKLAFRGDINLTWNQYLSGDYNVSQHSDLGLGLLLDLKFLPDNPLSFLVRDGFTRAVTPPPAWSPEDFDRDKNDLTLGVLYKPGGGAIQGSATYTFGVDIFERSALGNMTNRLQHTFALGAKWQWLPKTQFNFDFSLGIVDSAGDSVGLKSDSMPLRVTVGTSTLITPTFGTVIKIGYGNGFYSAGPSFNSYLATVEGRVAIGPMLRVAFGYGHEFQDSLLGNYFVDHAIYGRASTQFGGRTQLRGKLELRLRDYDGVPAMVGDAMLCGNSACSTSDRTDVIARLDLNGDYQINEWLFGGASYSLYSDTTDFWTASLGRTDAAGFVWHEFLVRASAKF